MTVISDALRFRRLAEEDATLQLLRSPLAPVALAVLGKHLGGDRARIPVDDLHELVEADLAALREHFELRQTAKSYCADWRAAGWLIRRPMVASRGETLELSPSTVQALRLVEHIDAPRASATESRLVSIRDQLHRLARESDPDAKRRLADLERQREAINEQIERLQAGEDPGLLDGERARERLGEILRQAEDVPDDFVRLRGRFEQLAHELRARVLESDEAQATVLDDIFRGVDLVDNSDEGQTFRAFSALVLDEESSAELDADIASVLEREFVVSLPAERKRFLRSFVRTLRAGSGEVHDVLAEFARSLRRYVQSQEYRRDRVLRGSLRAALAAGLDASTHFKPFHPTRQELALSSLRISSVGAISLHDPSEFEGELHLDEQPVGLLDEATIRALARESEIDFGELARAINAEVSSAGVTLERVWSAHPATQGVASVIGLLALAMDYGSLDGEQYERVGWRGLDDVDREAAVPLATFTEKINE